MSELLLRNNFLKQRGEQREGQHAEAQFLDVLLLFAWRAQEVPTQGKGCTQRERMLFLVRKMFGRHLSLLSPRASGAFTLASCWLRLPCLYIPQLA